MARKIDKPVRRKKNADNDIDILHPERTAMLNGRNIVVREYGFVEGMRLRPLMQPFLDDLFEAMKAGQPANYQQALAIIAANIDAVTELAAVAADVEVEWVRALSDSDGQALLMWWWGANCSFFMQRNLSRRQVELQENALQEMTLAQSDGAKSTPPSSPTTTAPGASATTPSDK
ncbi:DUF6631 family protein [Glaciimonas immobilis]|uniref:Uncharacterized protein n=1 Tax=Glaciimonas immobilis TaxID=728004 RepID=A0A840RNC7_9BURK|nr:DUF6631 family protein [Glaciimonas immobilis]KAF3999065.1 hypothetical protein HAV38_03730 [Glaciimonas immobilis]MBB5198496.1 hypothetical protein [Glaciimonas immobilis]